MKVESSYVEVIDLVSRINFDVPECDQTIIADSTSTSHIVDSLRGWEEASDLPHWRTLQKWRGVLERARGSITILEG